MVEAARDDVSKPRWPEIASMDIFAHVCVRETRKHRIQGRREPAAHVCFAGTQRVSTQGCGVHVTPDEALEKA